MMKINKIISIEMEMGPNSNFKMIVHINITNSLQSNKEIVKLHLNRNNNHKTNMMEQKKSINVARIIFTAEVTRELNKQ